jgi:hypothetical protein
MSARTARESENWRVVWIFVLAMLGVGCEHSEHARPKTGEFDGKPDGSE